VTIKLNTRIEDIDLQDLPFATDILNELDTQKIEVGTPSVGSVNLSKVVGTTHPDYFGKAWGELKPIPGTLGRDFVNNVQLNCPPLKRAYGNVKELDSNPQYYLNSEDKYHWSFYEIDGDYYISSGNNRTIIGRLFLHLNDREPIIHGVKVTPAKFKEKLVKPDTTENTKSGIFNWIARVLKT
jgi:hypothetical protein